MAATTRSLDELRTRIDAIDDAVHDLLMERAGLAASLRAAKSNQPGAPGIAFRPDREAAIIRRLVGSNDYPSKQMFETFELWNGGADRVFAPGDVVNMPAA